MPTEPLTLIMDIHIPEGSTLDEKREIAAAFAMALSDLNMKNGGPPLKVTGAEVWRTKEDTDVS